MIRLIFLMILWCPVITCLGQSQGEMNQKAAQNYQKADKELNSTYQKILQEYKNDSAFIKNFKAA